jgi:hypothetical protein
VSHPAPILKARECPPQMLPRNAKALMKRAESRGLRCRATIAIGFREFGRQGSEDYRPVRSVLLKVQSDKGRIAALWIGPVDGSEMSFEWGWKSPGPWPLNSKELKAEVDAL